MIQDHFQNTSVALTECLLRDGIQSLDRVLSTAQKIHLLKEIADAGFSRIEVTSFVPPKYLPQFYDSNEVLAATRPYTNANLITFVPNALGMQRVEQTVQAGYGPNSILTVVSASEAHNEKNLRRSVAQTCQDQQALAKEVHTLGLRLIGSISVSFGCPYTGDVPIENVFRLIDHYQALGAHEIQFGDTTGTANPLSVQQFYDQVLPRLGNIVPIAHFHDTRGVAIANSLMAIRMGVRIVDTSLGGLGGRPPSQRIQSSGPTGNTSTEDLTALLQEMGVKTGINLAKMITLGHHLQSVLETGLFSHVLHAGLIAHS